MRDTWERTVSVLVAIAAVATAAAFIHREFFNDPVPSVAVTRKSESVPNWRDVLPVGRLVGDTLGQVRIIEFADLECPFCRNFNIVLRDVAKRYPKDVAVVFVHLPLPGHRFARPAARAAECAYDVGRFASLVDAIYEGQDSLGLKSWTAYALTAGIVDTLRFGQCVRDTTALPFVEAGVAMAAKMNVSSTPTVFVNDWRFASPPTASDLQRAIESVLAGRKPTRRSSDN